LNEPVWGFELVHNNGEEEGFDTEMIGLLERGFPPLPQTMRAQGVQARCVFVYMHMCIHLYV